jgi:hypothetical protein
MPLKEVTSKLISIKEEYSGISERLQKLEERKSSVSEKIFAKVKGEYDQKHSELLKEIRPTLLRARQIINELKESVDSKKALKKEYSESLEEFELRFALGEFDQAEFDSQTEKIRNDISEVDSVISGVDESIQNVERLIEWFSGHIRKSDTSPSDDSAASSESAAVHTEKLNTIHEDETIEDFPEKMDDLEIDEEALLAGVETIDESSLLESFSNPGRTFSEQPEIAVNTRPVSAPAVTDLSDDERPAEQPPAPRRKEAVLEKIKNSRVEKIVPLNSGETAVGRGNNNDLVLLDRTVSREHALISLEPDGYILTDLNSTRGTFINGMRSDSKLLEEGDEIIIGSMVFRFKYI